MNGLPAFTLAVAALVMTGTVSAGGLIVSARLRWPVPPALAAAKDTVNEPAAVGMPEITPVPASTFNPAGRPLALKLVGVLLAVMP